MQIFKYNKI